MEKFNSNKFIKALKESYDAIPYIQGDQAIKVLVADAIKAGKFNPEDVLTFICDKVGDPSIKLDDAGWKAIYKRAIKLGGLIGKCLKVCSAGRKGKDSPEDLFTSVVTACGGNPDYLKKEFYCNAVVGWEQVADILTKIEPAEETKVETHIKTKRLDPRCKSIILINKDGEVKEWPSFRICERELGFGPGTASQLVSGKLKQSKGWRLWKEETVATTA
ncbi:MAG: hypothetical protein IJQ79_06665 [Bacteroidales bacterium]|nr:hypothetical protein [Bacteroidales bacterium]